MAVAHTLQNSPKGRSISYIAVKTDIALMKSEVTIASDLSDVEPQLVLARYDSISTAV